MVRGLSSLFAITMGNIANMKNRSARYRYSFIIMATWKKDGRIECDTGEERNAIFLWFALKRIEKNHCNNIGWEISFLVGPPICVSTPKEVGVSYLRSCLASPTHPSVAGGRV
jgi:hypothetical protein